MRLVYYTLSARLIPGWKLPHPKSLQVEKIRVKEKGAAHGADIHQLKGWASARAVDAARWKSPPHIAFANLGYDPTRRGGAASDEDVLWFTTWYGPLGAGEGEDTAAQPEEPFWLSLTAFRFVQAQLREAWTKRNARLFADPANLGASLGYDILPISWELKGDHLEMRPASCYAYMAILLARDIASGCAKICQNPNCGSPYFVAQRNDAKFCSHPCAVAVNVNRFRQRQKRRTRRKK